MPVYGAEQEKADGPLRKARYWEQQLQWND